MRHRAFRIEFGALLKRPDRGAMIESVEKTKALIENSVVLRPSQL